MNGPVPTGWVAASRRRFSGNVVGGVHAAGIVRSKLIENKVVVIGEIDFNGIIINNVHGSDAGENAGLGGISLSRLDLTAWALKGVPVVECNALS